MKLDKSTLKQIIKEELQKLLLEFKIGETVEHKTETDRGTGRVVALGQGTRKRQVSVRWSGGMQTHDVSALKRVIKEELQAVLKEDTFQGDSGEYKKIKLNRQRQAQIADPSQAQVIYKGFFEKEYPDMSEDQINYMTDEVMRGKRSVTMGGIGGMKFKLGEHPEVSKANWQKTNPVTAEPAILDKTPVKINLENPLKTAETFDTGALGSAAKQYLSSDFHPLHTESLSK